MLDCYNRNPEGAITHGRRALTLACQLGELELPGADLRRFAAQPRFSSHAPLQDLRRLATLPVHRGDLEETRLHLRPGTATTS